MTNLFQKIKKTYFQSFERLDAFLQKKPQILNFLVAWFDFSSRITHLMFFDAGFFCALCFSLYLVSVKFPENVLGFFMFLADQGMSLTHVYVAFSTELNFISQIVFLSFFILTELVFINGFLCQIPSIKKK